MAMDMAEKSVLIEEMLKLNKVEAGEKVVIVTTHEYNQDDLRAYREALSRLETQAFHIVLPPRAKGARLKDPGTPFFYEVLRHADMVLLPKSSCVEPLPSIHSDGIMETLHDGVRALTIQLPLEKVRTMWPTPDLIERTLIGARLMEEAETIRIISGNDVELVMNKKGRPAHTQHGIADVPGRWDNFAFGCVSSTPWENSATGTLVVGPPAAISPLVRFVQEPFKLTLKNGYITNIEGGLEAKLLGRWLEQWDDPESYGTSHVGWGTHKRVGVGEGGGRANLVSYLHNAYGTLLIAFGSSVHPHTAQYSGGGGQREAASHCDIGAVEVDFYLDDRLVCRDGKIVDPECR
ncbi:MAG: hypothetical protein M5U01_22130 [Ardenticatenaceae bacterium]|nr:hypothetical protein [Ardenticatenaceae bacterium]